MRDAVSGSFLTTFYKLSMVFQEEMMKIKPANYFVCTFGLILLTFYIDERLCRFRSDNGDVEP